MVYSTISASRNVSGFMKYVRDEKAHTEGKDRVLGYETQNVMLHNAEKSMLTSLYRHGKSNNVHGTAVMVSFHNSELSSERDGDVEKALRISKNTCLAMIKDNEFERLSHVADVDQRNELAEIEARKYKIVSVAQDDGAGGNLHVHNYILNINPETGRSLNGRSRYHSFVKKTLSDEMMREGVREYDVKSKEVSTKWEKQRREKGEYVWKDDLRERIKNVLKHPQTLSDDVFEMELVKVGVHAKKRGKGYSFAFEDAHGTERKARGTKLGTDFEMIQIQNVLEMNRKREEEWQKQLEQERERERIRVAMEKERREKAIRMNNTRQTPPTVAQKLQKRPESILKREAVQTPVNAGKPLRTKNRVSDEQTRDVRNEIPRSGMNDVSQKREECKVKGGVGRDVAPDPYLKFVTTQKIVFFKPSGASIGSDEPMTVQERMSIWAKKPISVDELLRRADDKTLKVRPARYEPRHNKYQPVDKLGDKDVTVTLKGLFQHWQKENADFDRKLKQLDNITNTISKQKTNNFNGPSL
ncbi:TPA: relaxase/mobilization nuclease domain-containing protein [Streptococcus suis]